MTSKKVQDFLNDAVATHGVLFTKLHQYHWYVKGPHFFALHKQFEKMYKEVNEQFDELAERLLAIGGRPYATLQEFLDHSVINEKPVSELVSGDDLVQSLVNDLNRISNNLAEGIKLTGDEGDDVSQDLLIDYKGVVDKKIWMFQAYLGNAPLEGLE